MAKTKNQSPSEVLQSLMAEYELNPSKLGEAIKASQATVRLIAIGKAKVSVPFALRLAKYFGNTPQYWIDLQNQYDLAEASKDSELSAILKSIPKAKKPVPKKEAAPAKKQAKPGSKPRAKKA